MCITQKVKASAYVLIPLEIRNLNIRLCFSGLAHIGKLSPMAPLSALLLMLKLSMLCYLPMSQFSYYDAA